MALAEFPILRRLFLSVCSVRPDNAELERHFSALSLLLSPTRRGRMKWQTIERKIFLVLNKHHWRPLPDVPDDDPYYHEIAMLAGLQEKPKPPADEMDEDAAAELPPLATPLAPMAYIDTDEECDE